MENHHAINGKTHYSVAMFNSYVKLTEGTLPINLRDDHNPTGKEHDLI